MPETPDGGYILDDTIYKFDHSFCSSCKHFHGREKGTCPAYPNGIPARFAFDLYRHNEIQEDQTGNYMFISVLD